MKRVGILTLYYRTYNYGAQLQAYALQKTITSLGYKCEQICFLWCRESTIEGYRNASLDHNSFMDFSLNIPHSRKVYDADNIHECLNDYDIFVCGSDQIWGVADSMPIYKLPIMALSFVPAHKIKIAYAASLGGAVTSSKIEEVLRITLRDFDALSVREKSACSYLQGVVGLEVTNVLDPVLLLSADQISEVADNQIEEPYIFFYTVSANTTLEDIALHIAEEEKIRLISVGYINGQAIGPREFLGLIQKAYYVITDSFHATVLSIILHKNFLVTPVDRVPTKRSRNIRLQDLLRLFELDWRYVGWNLENQDNNQQVKKLLETPINYEHVDRLLSDYKCKSLNFLSESLCIEKGSEMFLKKREQCTGCGICALSCPNTCITMKKDDLGFVYPHREEKHCILCGKCKEVCESKKSESIRFQSYPIVLENDERIRRSSSSGGAFYGLAKTILQKRGTVVACTYDDRFQVIHSICEDEDKLDSFCCNRYVQSNAFECFELIKKKLQNGKKVMFVGTPCQTHALTVYLGEVPTLLYRVDLVCGGVTAPGLWEKYLVSYGKRIQNISMRYKYGEFLDENGFPNSAMEIQFADGTKEVKKGPEDLFLGSRLPFYRECCYHCEYKGIEHNSDITLGDFFGTKEFMPEVYNGKETTLAIIHTLKGRTLVNSTEQLKQYPLDQTISQKLYKKNIMVRKPYHEYLRKIFENAGIERLYYESRIAEEFFSKEELQKAFDYELQRNSLHLRLQRFRSDHLWIDDFPEVGENVYVYGAGKLGKELIGLIESEVQGFIDGKCDISNCMGIPVYQIDAIDLKKALVDGRNVTVIVTPVWDMDIISQKLRNCYPKLKILSLKDLLDSLWI